VVNSPDANMRTSGIKLEDGLASRNMSGSGTVIYISRMVHAMFTKQTPTNDGPTYGRTNTEKALVLLWELTLITLAPLPPLTVTSLPTKVLAALSPAFWRLSGLDPRMHHGT
jgi:hypothetical protein